MIHSEMKVGVRVKCVHLHCGHAGKYGTVVAGESYNYSIKFDGEDAPIVFGAPTSFELEIPSVAEYYFSGNILEKPIRTTGHFCEPGQNHCHQCHRANNIGVSVCWNCATLDPCPTNLK